MALAVPLPTLAQTCGADWSARLTSIEGTVEARRSQETDWTAAHRDDVFCVGDSIRVQAYSRAALALPDETVVRLDQNTAVTFVPPQDAKRTWLDVLRGAVHIIGRRPTALRVLTPFANAGIEGTEFSIVVGEQETTVTVFEGNVSITNSGGEANVASGQQASARAGQRPVVQTVLRPRDAVQWALYYAPVFNGALPGAEEAPTPQLASDPRFFTRRAARRLAVGRVAEARADIARAASLGASDGETLALQSIIALTQNDAAQALRLANEALAASESAPALIALSYAQQATFDIAGARATLQRAVRVDAQDALAWARLSELWLASGNLDEGLSAARTAAALNPGLARTQTVLGFAYLTLVDIAHALEAFDEAIRLDEGAPLPRLGLGLALIRSGELVAGRAEIENAVILDPGNALIRSYMGKAYYEEKRDGLAASQLEIAKSSIRWTRRPGSTTRFARKRRIGPSRRCATCSAPSRSTTTGPSIARACCSTRIWPRAARASAESIVTSASRSSR